MVLRTQQIYDQLEDDIVNLRLHPGQVLSENTLCDRFEVSRTPIRSVLQRLADGHLVEVLPRRGTVVTPIRYAVLTQLIYQRVATETAILRDFMSLCGPRDLLQLHHYMALMDSELEKRRTGQSPDEALFFAADRGMHEVWYRATGKGYLWEQINAAKADYIRFCLLDLRKGASYEEVVAEHAALVQAVERREMSAIEPVVRAHFEGGVRRLGDRVDGDLAEYFDLDGTKR